CGERPVTAVTTPVQTYRRPHTGGGAETPSATGRSPQPAPPGAPDTATGTTTGTGSRAAEPPDHKGGDTSGIGNLDIEELARRLIEPVGRLLRADLRRGRERAGRLYDGRR
ncbi:hypothetical protein KDA82_15545, partial [Streptomyces daliensis]|nr:hypothetical protein [Streptomyces daliensis]